MRHEATSGEQRVRLHQLEGFYWVGRAGGFARATAAMPRPLTEPALHQQVRELERSLGISLLVQGPGRRMVLTPEGRSLHAFLEPFFSRLPAVLGDLARRAAGTLVVGSDPLYVSALVAPALAGLRADAPEARPSLVELDHADLPLALAAGDVDLAVTGLHAPSSELRSEPLGQLSLALLAPPDHSLARRRRLKLEHLQGERALTYPRRTAARAFTDAALLEAGLAVEVAAEAVSADSLRSLARAGLGLAYVPTLGAQRAARQTLPCGVVSFDLTRLVSDRLELPAFGLQWHPARALAGLAGALARHLRARAAALR